MKRPILSGAAIIAFTVVTLLVGRALRSGSGGSDDATPTIVAVDVSEIVRTTLRGYADTWGTVEPEPSTADAPPANARVASPVAGIVAQVRCSEGQRVEKGALLFALDSRVADVAVDRARQAAQFAEQGFARQQKLGAGEATSQKAYQEAEQNLAALRNELATALAQRALLNITAPLAGTVVKVNAKPGDAVDLTSGLAEIIDLDRLVVSTGVRSADVARVRLGQPATLSVESSVVAGQPAASAELTGRVVFIGAQIDSRTDNVSVRVSVPRSAGFRPGQFLKVRIAVEERRDRLAVPVESVVTRDDASTIALVDGDRAIWHRVQVGLRDGNLVEIAGDDLRAGLKVVTAGAYGLPDSSRIRVSGR